MAIKVIEIYSNRTVCYDTIIEYSHVCFISLYTIPLGTCMQRRPGLLKQGVNITLNYFLRPPNVIRKRSDMHSGCDLRSLNISQIDSSYVATLLISHLVNQRYGAYRLEIVNAPPNIISDR